MSLTYFAKQWRGGWLEGYMSFLPAVQNVLLHSSKRHYIMFVCFFSSPIIYFHTRGDEMFPVRQENCRVALQVFLSRVGPRILGPVPSRLALRGMAVLKQVLLFLPRS